MKRQTPRKASDTAATFVINADGQRIALVPVQGSDRPATAHADWYEAKKAEGWSMHWRLGKDGKGNAYVKLMAYTPRGHERELPVSRLIAGAGVYERVRARDGDPLNLLAENLETYHGFARYAAADWYPSAAALRAAGIEPTEIAMGIRKRKKAVQHVPIEVNNGQAAEAWSGFRRKFPLGYLMIERAAITPRTPSRSHSSSPEASSATLRSS